MKNEAAVALGSLGGSAGTDAQNEARARNAIRARRALAISRRRRTVKLRKPKRVALFKAV